MRLPTEGDVDERLPTEGDVEERLPTDFIPVRNISLSQLLSRMNITDRCNQPVTLTQNITISENELRNFIRDYSANPEALS